VYMAQRVHMHSSTTMFRYGSNNTQDVSIGGINQKWNEDGINRLRWFPKVVHVNRSEEITYYELPADSVLLPFHSLNGANPGHLVWDDFLPIYTLLSMFQIADRELILLRYVLKDAGEGGEQQRGLWASCDVREEKREDCRKMMSKFAPLMAGSDARSLLTSTEDYELKTSLGGPPETDLVCAKTGAAGIGSLTGKAPTRAKHRMREDGTAVHLYVLLCAYGTQILFSLLRCADHGTVKSHGWEESDYEVTHNHGRGGLLYEFRNFMVENLGLPIHPANNQGFGGGGPHRIVFSQKSSDIYIRSLDFERQLEIVRTSFPNERVENYTLKSLTLHEQVEIASQASIFVTLCGGGAVTAMFLPRGASVIVYYGEDSGTENNKLTGKPALLDWDLFNSMSHLRVHWMPRNSRKKTVDERALILLIQHELTIIESRAFD